MRKILFPAFALILLPARAGAAARANPAHVRFAIVDLGHGHVRGILKDIAVVPQAGLVATPKK